MWWEEKVNTCKCRGRLKALYVEQGHQKLNDKLWKPGRKLKTWDLIPFVASCTSKSNQKSLDWCRGLDNPHMTCNTPTTPWPGLLSWQLSRISRLSPQTNTSLSCALCPHSCTLGKYFPVVHPSLNCSRPSMLNLKFFSDELTEKKVCLVDMSSQSILLSSGPTLVQKLPLLDTSVRPVPTHVPRWTSCPRRWPAHARVTAKVSSDTKCNIPTTPWPCLLPLAAL
jgi:hypothetical protein